MSDKTPTAVDLAFEYFDTLIQYIDEEKAKEFNAKKTESLEIEKQQIMKAVEDGFNEGSKHPEDIKIYTASQYYTETYKP